MPQPRVADRVHYVSYGTPGGEYPSTCRAAIITALTGDPNHPDQVALAVLNPEGMFFNRAVPHHVAAETPIEPAPKGGTWHALDHCPELPKES